MNKFITFIYSFYGQLPNITSKTTTMKVKFQSDNVDATSDKLGFSASYIAFIPPNGKLIKLQCFVLFDRYATLEMNNRIWIYHILGQFENVICQ